MTFRSFLHLRLLFPADGLLVKMTLFCFLYNFEIVNVGWQLPAYFLKSALMTALIFSLLIKNDYEREFFPFFYLYVVLQNNVSC